MGQTSSQGQLNKMQITGPLDPPNQTLGRDPGKSIDIQFLGDSEGQVGCLSACGSSSITNSETQFIQ